MLRSTEPDSEEAAFLLKFGRPSAPAGGDDNNLRPASPRHSRDMSLLPNNAFIIVGLTTAGKKFRPSDWAERLCGVLSAFGAEKKMKYSPYVGPGDYNGEKAVFVDGRLHDIEPMAYRFVLNFANDNDLQVIEGVCPIDGNRSKT